MNKVANMKNVFAFKNYFCKTDFKKLQSNRAQSVSQSSCGDYIEELDSCYLLHLETILLPWTRATFILLKLMSCWIGIISEIFGTKLLHKLSCILETAWNLGCILIGWSSDAAHHLQRNTRLINRNLHR